MSLAGALLATVLHVHGWAITDVFAVAHSHNDYEQHAPLAEALAAGFRSVEADVWLAPQGVVVSHGGWPVRGTLEELYLRPLQARVDRLGSVQGDGRVFYLWIDLKDGSPRLTEALQALLSRYGMLTVFSDQGQRPAPVVAVLTGDDDGKRRYTDAYPVRFACRDENELREAGAPGRGRWLWYALSWWQVVDESAHDAHSMLWQLRAAVERVHAQGRKLRLYAMPERRDAWDAAIAAGVDLVGTDRLEAFGAYLRSRAARDRPPVMAAR